MKMIDGIIGCIIKHWDENLNPVKVKVVEVEVTYQKCSKCYISHTKRCRDFKCRSYLRKDGKDVIFEKVEEKGL